MTENHPDWWQEAVPELHAAVAGFTGSLRKKVQQDPWLIIKRKNPYLFRVRAGNSAFRLASQMVDAFLSSSEETIFGDVLEELAIIISRHARGGQKSGIGGIDLEYTDDDGTRVLIQIKSGVNWGNASQRKGLDENFRKARVILRQGTRINVRCIEGCCYGNSQTTDKGNHELIVGAPFWREISKWEEAGYALLDILGEHAENGLQELRDEARDRILAYFDENGIIDGDIIMWDKLLYLVTHPKPRKRTPRR